GGHGAGRVAGVLGGRRAVAEAPAVEALALEGGEARVVRRLDRGEREELVVALPAVIGVEPGIARPRTASPAALIAARDVAIAVLPPAGGAPRAAFLGHRPPRPAPPRMRAPAAALPGGARIAPGGGTGPPAPCRPRGA